MKKLIVSCLLASAFVAQASQAVYVTEHGKKYHLYNNCRALSKSKVLTVDIKDIKDRMLCAICKHRAGMDKE